VQFPIPTPPPRVTELVGDLLCASNLKWSQNGAQEEEEEEEEGHPSSPPPSLIENIVIVHHGITP
jgi:hypothetical protein